MTLNASRPAPSNRTLVVALVEDDRLLREEISIHLSACGFEVRGVSSALALEDISSRVAVDLYVIDINLPGENGLSLSARLRQSRPAAGIVIITARVALHDRIAGYRDGGADIYLTKPIAPDELVLVLQGLGRRVRHISPADEWLLNIRDRTLTGPSPEQRFRLTHREKSLLVALIQARDNTIESAVLCDLFAGDEDGDAFSKHALEELVARLRRKFRTVHAQEAEPAIKSVWGVGYQLCVSIALN